MSFPRRGTIKDPTAEPWLISRKTIGAVRAYKKRFEQLMSAKGEERTEAAEKALLNASKFVAHFLYSDISRDPPTESDDERHIEAHVELSTKSLDVLADLENVCVKEASGAKELWRYRLQLQEMLGARVYNDYKAALHQQAIEDSQTDPYSFHRVSIEDKKPEETNG